MTIPFVSRSEPLSKRQFHASLAHWLHSADEEQVGDDAVQGRKAWIWVRDGDRLFNLHADSKRAAISRYVELAEEHGPELEWAVVPSIRGKLTRVVFGPDQEAIPGFYLYRE